MGLQYYFLFDLGNLESLTTIHGFIESTPIRIFFTFHIKIYREDSKGQFLNKGGLLGQREQWSLVTL